jgi:beta-galactosidase/beta-glucuronidase
MEKVAEIYVETVDGMEVRFHHDLKKKVVTATSDFRLSLQVDEKEERNANPNSLPEVVEKVKKIMKELLK